MKLMIRRARHSVARGGTAFTVSFHLELVPAEQHWVEQLSLFDKWVSQPEICPDGNKCTTPRWKVKDLLTGVQLHPRTPNPAVDCYGSLRQVLHAEADLRRGCEFLAAALDDAENYEGVREILYRMDGSGSAA